MGQFEVSLRLVVTGKIPNAGLEVLRQAGFTPDAWMNDTAISRQELLEKVKGADVLITLLTERDSKTKPFSWPQGLAELKVRKYGAASIYYGEPRQ